MATHALTQQFQFFFGRLNPGASFTSRAVSEHTSIIRLLTRSDGPAGALKPHCFLQGSYKQQTAIDTINDIDIVALCQTKQGWGYFQSSRARGLRDQLFETLGDALREDAQYQDKVRYGAKSMCVKVDLGIRVEILPAIYPAFADYATEPFVEPFLLYRPRTAQWEKGFARKHQNYLTYKNAAHRTAGNFIPAVKVFKHLRSYHGLADVVSFHLECLLYALPNHLFLGAPADYLGALVHDIVQMSSQTWSRDALWTPCNDRNIFTEAEWSRASWREFYDLMAWLDHLLSAARATTSRDRAIATWQLALGADYFPAEVAS